MAARRVRWVTVRPDTLIALAIYIGYALFLTWPLVTDPGGMLSSSGISGDLGGSVSQVAYIVQHHVFPYAPATLHGLDAPQGLSVPWVLNWGNVVGSGLLYLLGYAFGSVAGHAVSLWLCYVLSGMAMFLLTRRLFGNARAALLAGFVFAFSPWAVQGMSGHYDYMQGWVLVLAVWRMLELAVRPTVRNGLLAGCATTLSMWLTPYFLLIGGVSFAVMAVVVLASSGLRGELVAAVRGLLAAVVPIVLVFGGIGVLTLLAGGGETGAVRTQDITELYTYSARLVEWVLPDRNNLIFGGLTSPYLTSHLHGSNFSEASLYMGVSVIVLALAGLWLAIVRLRSERRGATRDIRVIAVLAGILVALVAAWFSAPPKVHLLGIWVPTPSFFVFHVTSTFRVYSRFVELIELGLCLPLGFALARLFARPRGLAAAGVFAAVAAILVLDLWARPAIRTTKIVALPEYAWLEHHPGGIVADYPLEPAEYPDYSPLFWQMIHRHPLFQGYVENSEDESMKLDMTDLRSPTTAGYLADLGVRYIVVHPGQPGADLPDLERHGYVLRYGNPDGSVLQVKAAPAATRVDALAGFWLMEGPPNDEYRWMNAPGVLGVYARNCPFAAGSSPSRARAPTCGGGSRCASTRRARCSSGRIFHRPAGRGAGAERAAPQRPGQTASVNRYSGISAPERRPPGPRGDRGRAAPQPDVAVISSQNAPPWRSTSRRAGRSHNGSRLAASGLWRLTYQAASRGSNQRHPASR